MISGWIILDKPLGLGSTQAVAAVKRNLRQAGFGKVKVGHGGTLDPLASGVLPVALGEATKLTGRLLDASKVYEFTIAFGTETDTLDVEGEVVVTSEARPALAAIEALLPRFTGAIEQVPPAYSALKIDGQRAYDLARAGEAVELAARQVEIYSLALSSPLVGEDSAGCSQSELAKLGEGYSQAQSPSPLPTATSQPFDSYWTGKSSYPLPPGERIDSITLTAHVSKGTYVRSLARDIAHALGTCGHVTYLRRTKAGPFTLEQAISLDKLNEIGKGARLEPHLLPLEAGLDDIPALDLAPEEARAVRQGRVLSGMSLTDGQYLARCGGVPLALVTLAGGEVRVVRGFNLKDVAE